MATDADIVVQLNQINTTLQAANAEIAKVGTETDTLNQKISDLQALIAAGTVGQPLVDAVNAVAASAAAVSSGIAAVDAKVPDAVTGPPVVKPPTP